MNTKSNVLGFSNQDGAVLIVSLMLLIILTMLGISTMESTKLQTRMAANMVDYNYAFQISEVGVEIPRGYTDADIFDITNANDPTNIGIKKPAGYAVTRKTIGGELAKAHTNYVTAKTGLPDALQDISGSGDCGANSGCKIMFFITRSIGVSDQKRANSPSVSLQGGLRKKVVDETASGVTRVTDY